MRTDVHSPKNLITEDYEYIGCGYYGSHGEPGYSPLVHEAKYLIDEGWRFGQNESAGECYHCGAHLKYYALLKHLPSHTIIRVGETCLDNRFERSSMDFHKMRKQAQLDRERQRIKLRRIEWTAENTDHMLIAAALVMANKPDATYDEFAQSLWSQFQRKGELSEKQVAAYLRKMERDAEYQQRKAEREAQDAALSADVPADWNGNRVKLTGTLLSVKSKDTPYGWQLKGLLRTDQGCKLYGTIPASIDHAEKGDRVEFVAAVETSKDDPQFGFWSRPAQAGLIA